MIRPPAPELIIFPSSSGGTQAGLTLGGRIFDFRGSILGISIDNPALELAQKVAKLAEETAQKLGVDQKFSAKDILVDDNYLGGGYGIMGDAEVEAKIQEETKATIRCIPFDRESEPGKCMVSGKPSEGRVIFARSY